MKACPRCHQRYPTDVAYCFLDGAGLTAIHDALIGATIGGQYLVEEVIGEGGMATVYRARHKLVDRPCAVKVMNASLAADMTVRERFRREAKSVKALAHPNIVEIFDQGETADGTPYMVMELLDGETLAQLIVEGPLAMPRAIPMMIQMARAIARAHDLGVVHRDLKPENVFICRRADGSDLVKIIDFGIARAKGDSRLTNAGELFGTPQYMAPERVSAGDTGPSVDLYALGVIFFETATGELPFDANDPTTLLIKHMNEPPPSPRAIHGQVPEKLDTLVLQLLEKNPRTRPVDLHRVESDLVALARELRLAIPPEPENDPASSAPPVRTLPAAAVTQWGARVELFEQMLSGMRGADATPDLLRMLGEVKDLVRELSDARKSSAREQRTLDEIDVRGREGRQRFGFAVDALGLDASRARDHLRAARTDVERFARDSARAAEAYTEAVRDVVTWEGRSGFVEPYPQLAEAYRRCADAVEVWLALRRGERDGQTVLADGEQAASDLDYQLTELRGALATHEQAIDRERAAAHSRLVDLNARAERIETRLLQLATRFCEPLRERPELGTLFRRLESDAASSA
jgi:eukaryotic-like serine/threonine-protein kinase